MTKNNFKFAISYSVDKYLVYLTALLVTLGIIFFFYNCFWNILAHFSFQTMSRVLQLHLEMCVVQ